MDDRHWAAVWADPDRFIPVLGGVLDKEREGVQGYLWATDADLAEAVRVKYISTMPISTWPDIGDPWPDCVKTWGIEGAPAFITAVREVIFPKEDSQC